MRLAVSIVPNARADPYTVVYIEGIRLDTYAAGGIDLSVGELGRVDTAQVYIGKASGATYVSGFPYRYAATSGSGNIVTVSIATQSGEAGAEDTSGWPLTGVFVGH